MRLTDRQLQIVNLLIEGQIIKDIALRLNLGKSTIEKELFFFKDFYLSKTLIQAIAKHLQNGSKL